MSQMDIEELSAKICETIGELKSIENPHSIESGMKPDDPIINQTYTKLKQIPLKKKLSYISTLGKNHVDLGNSHKFIEMSEGSRTRAINRLKEKIAFLESEKNSIF